ncbi:peptidase M15B and M15C, D,D-carboxypeptidase VanY/endolysin [Psychromonas sp. CNPT3]|uniref:M15 family metallopeptidase n=1 Tax=Psychromonas sp. CNPT3 TaxID=314282 RepID=UPI00006E80FB|nr:M15 family metallopeptidase [Psychromonas sp. CNPT3]AGH81365.1 peptidase M15B and M15C, D,D-carboxypeptidase VanY/endolysin [Psychromonas sp. CNPT3]
MLKTQLTGQVTSHLTQLHKNIYLHHDVKLPFLALQQSAKEAGFELHIASGFRSFERQKNIWNNKFGGNVAILDKNERPLLKATLSDLDKLFSILHWSALPGASRHHWGTDFDIYDVKQLPAQQTLQLKTAEYDQGGYFYDLCAWLDENMQKFGFYLPYRTYQGGVAREPWHISYFPISKPALEEFDLDLILTLIIENNVLGKSLICQQLPMIYKQYICNINAPEHISK